MSRTTFHYDFIYSMSHRNSPLCTPFYSEHLLLAPVFSFVLNHRNQSLTTDGLGAKTPDVHSAAVHYCKLTL